MDSLSMLNSNLMSMTKSALCATSSRKAPGNELNSVLMDFLSISLFPFPILLQWVLQGEGHTNYIMLFYFSLSGLHGMYIWWFKCEGCKCVGLSFWLLSIGIASRKWELLIDAWVVLSRPFVISIVGHHHILTYVEDAIAQLLTHKYDTPKVDLNKFFAQ